MPNTIAKSSDTQSKWPCGLSNATFGAIVACYDSSVEYATTTPGAPRLRADAARNQQRIVAAARELFAIRGLEITLDDVAERAGVGVGTVYRRFANKKKLITEVFHRHVDTFAEVAEECLRHPDPWLGLVELMEYACRHMATNRGFGEVILELRGNVEQFRSIRERIDPAVAAVVDRARAAGVIVADIGAADLFVMIRMVAAAAAFAGSADSESWRRYLSIVLNGIRADGTPRREITLGATDGSGPEAIGAYCPMNHHRGPSAATHGSRTSE